MALVALAGLFGAALFVLFKLFAGRWVEVRAAIVVNYLVAAAIAFLIAAPIDAAQADLVLLPSMLVGVAFVAIFHVLAWSTRLAGVAPTTVAAKISMVIPVIAAVITRREAPGAWGWCGMVLALCGVVLSSWSRPGPGSGARLLPLLIFMLMGTMDAVIGHIQHTRLTPSSTPVFTTLVFAFACIAGLAGLTTAPVRTAFLHRRTWLAGAAIGAANVGALQFLVLALSDSGLDASAVFPLVNILVIVVSVVAARLIFGERTSTAQSMGVAISLIALALILWSGR